MADVEKLEEGDIFFFYRPRVEAERVRGRGDVQRFYMVLAPKEPRRFYRLFLVGRKKLPAVIHGRQHPERRNWSLIVRTSRDPDDIHRELVAIEYPTATRGERFTPAAKPVGEGRYQLLRHGDHTEIAYALELPRRTGPAQEEFEVQDEASYLVSVKNPDLATPGRPSSREPPAYPQHLRDLFGGRRWIDVEDPALLDYENTEVLLLGAHGDEAEDALGIDVELERERLDTADVCGELRAWCEREPARPLVSGEFPAEEEARPEEEGAALKSPEVLRLDGVGGSPAPSRGPVARLLEDARFPMSHPALVAFARQRRAPDDVVARLRALPDRTYESAAEVEAELPQAD